MARFVSKYLILLFIFFFSCDQDLQTSQIIYFNDFEAPLGDEITNKQVLDFQGNLVLGDFNKESVSINLNDIPDHAAVVVRLDLYVHGSWDGNGDVDGIVGPDIWELSVDDWVIFDSSNAIERKFSTTFSNGNCVSSFCQRQSYPDRFPGSFNPRSGSFSSNFFGVCSRLNEIGGSSLYRIEKSFRHKGQSISIRFSDVLVQNNMNDQKCDESWSIDNVEVEIWSAD